MQEYRLMSKAIVCLAMYPDNVKHPNRLFSSGNCIFLSGLDKSRYATLIKRARV
jgi:hypothetical protein